MLVGKFKNIYIYFFFFSNIKISKHQTSILVIRDSALSVNQILHSPYIISYAPSMERKPRQKLPFPTSIAIFRHININPKLYFFLSFFFSRHALIDQIDWKTSSVRKAKTKRAILFGLSSAHLKSHQHKCALSCKDSSALKCIKSIIENNIY